MIPLTPLESDILGDMAADSHNVGEIIGFVRSANPLQTDYEVFRATLALLQSWIGRGWLSVREMRADGVGMRSIDELLPYLQNHGVDVVSPESCVPLPEIDLTDRAFADVEWLRGAV